MVKKLIVALLALALVGGGIVYGLHVKRSQDIAKLPKTGTVAHGVVNGSPEGATIITLTKDGFKPSEVSITKGTTILFKTTTGNLYWPASNLHPSHLIYPEFDPQEPISPSDTWSYTFEKAGEWKFHDHLSPYFTGTITVTE